MHTQRHIYMYIYVSTHKFIFLKAYSITSTLQPVSGPQRTNHSESLCYLGKPIKCLFNPIWVETVYSRFERISLLFFNLKD